MPIGDYCIGGYWCLLLETIWKQTRNETLKVHEMKQLYELIRTHKVCMFQMLQSNKNMACNI
jgi:hypothetical protein